ncbi:universal stress protein [Amycolatopsis suaedae]|uniref:Universal stress protein n=1 Tax=Amycolatopsis suaedae TaxID=2510978 RepID=A0A4Q7JEI1_9PSEU|nr:universal stress protein [Amycolatopsis suaedae]RZQ65899.1 universal stress protein [Amycolatopsis suaedae]
MDSARGLRGYLASQLYVTMRPEEPPAPAREPAVPAKPVVAGVDGSTGGRSAAAWAAREAARRGVGLRLVHACLLPGLTGQGPDATATEVTNTWLADAAAVAEAAAPGVPITKIVIEGEAGPVLRQESESAALVVVGSRGLSALGRLVVGSVATTLALHGGCPVVVARTEPDPEGPVVVGVECAPEGEDAVSCAFDHAARAGAPLVAVRTWRDPLAEAWSGVPSTVDIEVVERAEHEALLDYLRPWLLRHPEVDVTARVMRSASPADGLLRAAKGARLLVVGSHGRGLLTGALLGSTSRAVMHHAECPVAVVRPPAVAGNERAKVPGRGDQRSSSRSPACR